MSRAPGAISAPHAAGRASKSTARKQRRASKKRLIVISGCIRFPDAVGIAGLARVCSTAHPDETQYDPESDYYDPKATREKPIWMCVDIEFVEKLREVISIAELRSTPGLEKMKILEK